MGGGLTWPASALLFPLHGIAASSFGTAAATTRRCWPSRRRCGRGGGWGRMRSGPTSGSCWLQQWTCWWWPGAQVGIGQAWAAATGLSAWQLQGCIWEGHAPAASGGAAQHLTRPALGAGTLVPLAMCGAMALVELPSACLAAARAAGSKSGTAAGSEAAAAGGPGPGSATSADAKCVQDSLHYRHQIECPVKCIAGRLYARISGGPPCFFVSLEAGCSLRSVPCKRAGRMSVVGPTAGSPLPMHPPPALPS